MLAQHRLGPGRIHHCMRWLGVARRAFDMMCERATYRHAHGSLLAEKQTVQNWIADSAAEMQAARLMTLHAAWVMDTAGRAGRPHRHRADQVLRRQGAARRGRPGAAGARLARLLDRPAARADVPLRPRRAHLRRPRRGPPPVASPATCWPATQPPADGVPSEHLPTRRELARERFARAARERSPPTTDGRRRRLRARWRQMAARRQAAPGALRPGCVLRALPLPRRASSTRDGPRHARATRSTSEVHFVERFELPVAGPLERGRSARGSTACSRCCTGSRASATSRRPPRRRSAARRRAAAGRRGAAEALYSEGLGEFAYTNGLPALPRPRFSTGRLAAPGAAGGQRPGGLDAGARAGRRRQGLGGRAGDRPPLRAWRWRCSRSATRRRSPARSPPPGCRTCSARAHARPGLLGS